MVVLRFYQQYYVFEVRNNHGNSKTKKVKRTKDQFQTQSIRILYQRPGCKSDERGVLQHVDDPQRLGS
jgi:hypothetical protein